MNPGALEMLLGAAPGPLDLLPIATLSGPFFVIDNRPGPDRGSVKQLAWDDAKSLDGPMWSDLATFLAAVREALVAGGPSQYYGFITSVRDGVVTWDAPVITYHDVFDDDL